MAISDSTDIANIFYECFCCILSCFCFVLFFCRMSMFTIDIKISDNVGVLTEMNKVRTT